MRFEYNLFILRHPPLEIYKSKLTPMRNQINFLRILILVLLSYAFAGCAFFAETFTGSKSFTTKETETAKDANRYFWDNFHQGNYDSIPEITRRLTLAMSENPNDIKVMAHLGFTHVWVVSERQRIENPSPEVIENLFLARRYFTEAYTMNDNDPRILGFMAGMELAEGQTFQNEKLEVQGYFHGLKSISMWPQFNKFTVGYIFSKLESSNKRYDEGLEWQWEAVDDCACKDYNHKINYKEMAELIKSSDDAMIKRACWNSWITPHNFEGFFLNFGDMLVKKGSPETAIKMYKAAKLSDSYNEWPYKDVLEERIRDASINISNFNMPLDEKKLFSQKVIMFNSKMSCAGCHQMSSSEFVKYGYKEPSSDYYFIEDK